MSKIKKYIKSMNPYLFASCGIVVGSALIIFALVRQHPPTEETETLVVEETVQSEWKEGEAVISDQMKETKEVSSEVQEPTDELLDSNEIIPPEPEKEEIYAQEDIISTEEPKESQEEESVQPEKGPELPEADVEKPTVENPKEEKEEESLPEEPEESVPTPPEEAPKESTTVPEEPKAHEHSWVFESYYQEPTCSNGGLVTEICAHCGETQITGGTATGEHCFEVETVGDCCSAEVVVCTECNYREVREKDEKNHIDVEDGFCYGCGLKVE